MQGSYKYANNLGNEEIMEEKIRKRAFEIYIRRTQSDLWQYGRLGTPEGDWKQAQKEIEDERPKVNNATS